MALHKNLFDRVYNMRVNAYKSQTYRSAVGIPQGSVISPIICNLYTVDSMTGVTGDHAENADDAIVWGSGWGLLISE